MNDKEERKNEIAFTIDLIQKLCESAEIALVARELKNGTLAVVIKDAIDGKEYAMISKRD